MAGSFGFERGQKHEVSMRIGEQGVLPAVRAASEDTLVLADGFSCREQIHGGTTRRALHLAEVARMAVAGDKRVPAVEEPHVLGPLAPAAAAVAALGAAGYGLASRGRRRAAPAARWLSRPASIVTLSVMGAVSAALAALALHLGNHRRRAHEGP
jgi:hypothetical protein